MPPRREGREMENMTQLERYKAFLAADQEWSRQLQAKYGKRAGDMRYTREGQQLPGHAAFVATGDAWRGHMVSI